MTPKKKEQTRGQCISTVCVINVTLLFANIIMPLPTGLGPVLIAIVVVDLIAFPIIFATKKPSGTAHPGSQWASPPSNTPQILCTNCNAPVEADQEFCSQCGQQMKPNF